jgi:hypothetical protein
MMRDFQGDRRPNLQAELTLPSDPVADKAQDMDEAVEYLLTKVSDIASGKVRPKDCRRYALQILHDARIFLMEPEP